MTARVLLVLVAAAALAGCGGLPEVKVPERVLVQVPVPCIGPENGPIRPETSTPSDLLAMERGRRTLAAWRDLMALHAYALEAEAALEACRRIRP